jgi:hypothetical protein
MSHRQRPTPVQAMRTDILRLVTDAVPLVVSIAISWIIFVLVELFSQHVANAAWVRSAHVLAWGVDVVTGVTLVVPKALEAVRTIVELLGDIGETGAVALRRIRVASRIKEDPRRLKGDRER